jgi:predicted lipoprotein with Yx(FWY)xxD motif
MNVRTDTRRRVIGIAVVAAAMLAGSARAGQGPVKVATDPKLGEYLTDEKGMALYTFKKDTPGKSACAGECLAAWPAFHAEKAGGSGGLEADAFATITRDDGKKQTAYKGMPLYYFVKDAKPGDTTGHAVKEVWFLAKP